MIHLFRRSRSTWNKPRILLAIGIVLVFFAATGAAWWWFTRPHVVVVRRQRPPKLTLENAIELYESGKYEEALDFCIKNRKLYRDDPVFWNFYGMTLKTMAYVDSNLSERDEEIAAFEKALELSPRFTAARMNYANTLWEIGHREKAAAQYREVLRENPDHPDFYAILERLETKRRQSALREEEIRRKTSPPANKETTTVSPAMSLPAESEPMSLPPSISNPR